MFAAEYPLFSEDIRLPFVVCGIGKSESQGHINREQGMCVHQLMYSVSGCGIVRCEGKEYRLEEGMAVVLRKKIAHEYYPVSESWNVSWVIFDGVGIEQILNYYRLDGKNPVRLHSVTAMENIFNQCYRIMKTKDRMCVYRAAPKLHELINEVYFAARDFGEVKISRDETLDNVLAYIDENYSRQLSLDELAELIGVGREYFCSLFRRKMGMRPFEYIAMKRVQEAKLLLSSTDMPVSEIGRMVGYEYKSYFGQVFKRYAGMSPSAFRGY